MCGRRCSYLRGEVVLGDWETGAWVFEPSGKVLANSLPNRSRRKNKSHTSKTEIPRTIGHLGKVTETKELRFF